MDDFANNLTLIINACLIQLPLVCLLVGALWVIQLINALTRYSLNHFGIIPRCKRGLIGIILCPLLHRDYEHLFINSIVLFVLLNLMLLYGMHTFIFATFIIVVLGGLLVWCFGRRAIHIGASGLVMGYWGFILVNAYNRGTMFAILVAILCLYYFAGLFFNLFPKDRTTSWEGHLYGFVAGVVAVFTVNYV